MSFQRCGVLINKHLYIRLFDLQPSCPVLALQVPPHPGYELRLDSFYRRAALGRCLVNCTVLVFRQFTPGCTENELACTIVAACAAYLAFEAAFDTVVKGFALDGKVAANRRVLRLRRQQALQQRGESDRQATRAHSDPSSDTCTPAALCRHPETALTFCPALACQCRARRCCAQGSISSRGCGGVPGVRDTAAAGAGGGACMLGPQQRLHLQRAVDEQPATSNTSPIRLTVTLLPRVAKLLECGLAPQEILKNFRVMLKSESWALFGWYVSPSACDITVAARQLAVCDVVRQNKTSTAVSCHLLSSS
jgi:hypothetical protein